MRVIAFYLPQYHPIEENNEWWGEGFTEWTNVGKAKPLFRGHYQPKVPADLGYYDLRLSEVRKQQAQMAKDAGIEGFCYYHYWFGNGKQLLEKPFDEVLTSKKPDYPFMLCWANESWHSKFWSAEGVESKKMLIEQKYDNEEGHKMHFYHLLPAFKDERYIKIDGKPAFMIYKPLEFKNIEKFIALWNRLSIENGLNGIYFIAHNNNSLNIKNDTLLKKGFNAVNIVRLWDVLYKRSFFNKLRTKLYRLLFSMPYVYNYGRIYKTFIGKEELNENIYPTIVPNWDHTPRSGREGYVLVNSTPENFSKHLDQVKSLLKKKTPNNQIAFLKSWNEWGEGNYMEPDLRFGKSFLDVFFEKMKE